MNSLLRALAPVAGALLLGGCLASVSVGGGGVSVGGSGGGVSIGASRGGVTVGAGAGGASVGVRIGGGRGNAGGSVGVRIGGGEETPPKRAPVPTRGPSKALLAKPVATGRLTSGFGPRRGRRHDGVDYAAPRGTAVRAAGDGVVEEIRHSASYGNYIRIRHGKALASAYAHLSEFADGLEKGVTVRRGETIGAVGATGRASGPHLHYEVISGGVFIDPLLVGR